MTLADAPDVLTVGEVAALLRIGRNQAYQFVRDGQLASFRSGTAIRIPKVAVARLLAGSPAAYPDRSH
jgi:excisionase family DNA binding protein